MTQNFSSSSLSDDRREQDDTHSSSEIRADIDQTRASVGEKIDQLQARLDPSRLKQQAQETVQEMLSDTATSMTDYVRTHRDEMVSSVADAARRNPLPTALVGLGLGWLILESMAGSKRHDNDSWEHEQRSSRSRQRGRFEGSTGRSFVSQGRGQYMEEDYYSPQYYNAPDSTGFTQTGDYTQAGSGQSGYASTTYGQANYGQSNYGQSGYSQSEYGRSGNPSYREERTEMQGSQEYGNGHHRANPLAKAADAVKGTVNEVRETVSDVTGEIKERVQDAGQEIRERVGDVRERIGGTMGDMRQQASHMGQQGQQRFNQMGNQMDQLRYRARYEGRRRGQQVMRNLEDNPLTYGALALAAGAALAILLPRTRTENRAFGEMRDRVMDRGQEVMETARGRAQQVASEIRPELEEKARQIVSDVKEMGKEMAKDAVDELRPVVDKAVSRGKEEARTIAQEAGGSSGSGSTMGSTTTGSTGMASSSTGGTSMGSSSTSGSSISGSSSTSSPSMGSSSTSGTGSSTMSTSGSSMSGTSTMGKSNTPVLNKDTLAGQWKQVKGEIKSKWGQLTDDDLTQAEGNYEKLVGRIQTRYGYARDRAERELDDFFKSRNV